MANTLLPPYESNGPDTTNNTLSEDSRTITRSASITGTYGLRESVHLETISGNIDVRIIPLGTPLDRHASLCINSKSGNIRVDLQALINQGSLCKCDIYISTLSGSVYGRLAHSFMTHASTMSGFIDVTVYMVSDDGSKLHTWSLSGSCRVRKKTWPWSPVEKDQEPEQGPTYMTINM